MIAVQERLKCQNCGNPLGDDSDIYGERIVCVVCSREHDKDGRLIPHPIGHVLDAPHHNTYGRKKRTYNSAYL